MFCTSSTTCWNHQALAATWHRDTNKLLCIHTHTQNRQQHTHTFFCRLIQCQPRWIDLMLFSPSVFFLYRYFIRNEDFRLSKRWETFAIWLPQIQWRRSQVLKSKKWSITKLNWKCVNNVGISVGPRRWLHYGCGKSVIMKLKLKSKSKSFLQ